MSKNKELFTEHWSSFGTVAHNQRFSGNYHILSVDFAVEAVAAESAEVDQHHQDLARPQNYSNFVEVMEE